MNIYSKYLKNIEYVYMLSAISMPQMVNLTIFSQYNYIIGINKVRPVVIGALFGIFIITPIILTGVVMLKRVSHKLSANKTTCIVSGLIPTSFLFLGHGKQPESPLPNLFVSVLMFAILSGALLFSISILLKNWKSTENIHNSSKNNVSPSYSHTQLYFPCLALFCIWYFILLNNFSGMTSSELMKKFEENVRAENNYRATRIMKELCTRRSNNMEEDGLKILNCSKVVNAYPDQIEFSRDLGTDGLVNWTGVARFKGPRSQN